MCHCTPGVLPQDAFAILQGASEAWQSHTMESVSWRFPRFARNDGKEMSERCLQRFHLVGTFLSHDGCGGAQHRHPLGQMLFKQPVRPYPVA